MGKHLPARPPASRVVYYTDPAQDSSHAHDVLLYSAAQLTERRAEQHALYLRWLARQAAIAERDRKVRRFWLGFGAVIGLVVLAVLAVLGWLAYTALTASLLGPAAILLGLLALAGLAYGGHRCITVIQHWH